MSGYELNLTVNVVDSLEYAIAVIEWPFPHLPENESQIYGLGLHVDYGKVESTSFNIEDETVSVFAKLSTKLYPDEFHDFCDALEEYGWRVFRHKEPVRVTQTRGMS